MEGKVQKRAFAELSALHSLGFLGGRKWKAKYVSQDSGLQNLAQRLGAGALNMPEDVPQDKKHRVVHIKRDTRV